MTELSRMLLVLSEPSQTKKSEDNKLKKMLSLFIFRKWKQKKRQKDINFPLTVKIMAHTEATLERIVFDAFEVSKL